MNRTNRIIIAVVAGLGFAAVPMLLGGYWLRVLTSVFMYAIMAQSVNIISGFTGYPALGNAVFFGAGAYFTAFMYSKLNLAFPLALLIGGLACFIYATLVGLPVLKLRGRYFLMATIALLELSKEITNKIEIVGGARGLTLQMVIQSPEQFSAQVYYLMYFCLLAVTIAVFWISRSKLGYALQAIKFDEDAAGVMGISPVPYKVLAWSLSAFFTGLAGGIFAYWTSYIEPPVVFDIATTVKMYLMFLLGGAGTIFGPLIGAFSIELISEFVWGKFMQIHYLILGAVMIAVVLLLPNGLAGLGRQMAKKIQNSYRRTAKSGTQGS